MPKTCPALEGERCADAWGLIDYDREGRNISWKELNVPAAGKKTTSALEEIGAVLTGKPVSTSGRRRGGLSCRLRVLHKYELHITSLGISWLSCFNNNHLKNIMKNNDIIRALLKHRIRVFQPWERIRKSKLQIPRLKNKKWGWIWNFEAFTDQERCDKCFNTWNIWTNFTRLGNWTRSLRQIFLAAFLHVEKVEWIFR